MISFCQNHSYIKNDGLRWRKVKNLKRTLLRIGKPAFVAQCPDCIDLERAQIAFLRSRDVW